MNYWLWLLLALPVPALAAPDIVFRCTDANGDSSVQDVPCPSGSTQVIQRRGAAASTTTTSGGIDTGPAPGAAGVLDSAAAAAGSSDSPGTERYEGGLLDSNAVRRAAREAAAAAEAAEDSRPPPPEIFRCTSSEGSQYLHEPGPAPPRCVPLAITGLGGSVAPGNAASCEVVRDSCEAADATQRCGSWQQRLRDARGRERFASAGNVDAARSERERIQAVLEASNCPVP